MLQYWIIDTQINTKFVYSIHTIYVISLSKYLNEFNQIKLNYNQTRLELNFDIPSSWLTLLRPKAWVLSSIQAFKMKNAHNDIIEKHD